MAEKLGCGGSHDVLVCLRNKTAKELLAQISSATSYATAGIYFHPNLDGYVLPGAPQALIDKGSFAHVPVLLGTVAQEASRFLPAIRSRSEWKAFAKRIWGDRAGKVMSLYPVTDDGDAYRAADAAMTDGRYGCPTWQSAIALQAQGVPVYLYRFTHAPYSGSRQRLGAYHGVENGYIFGNLQPAADRNVGPIDYALSAQLSEYWARFAIAGDPNSFRLPLWPKFSPENPKVQQLDTEIKAELYPQAAICKKWAAITRP
jgi:para-nitrobenzyl esterase